MRYRRNKIDPYKEIQCLALLRRYFLIVFFLICCQTSAQEIPNDFKASVDSILFKKPQDFRAIHSVFRKNRNDTLFMRYFASESAINSYSSGEAYALNEIGRKYRNIANYSKAAEFHKQALSVASEANNIEFKVTSLNYLGVVYRRISSIRTAMDYNQKALELAETVENPSLSLKRSINISHNSIGNLYKQLQQFDKAIIQFEKSLQLETELNNTVGQAINYQNLGKCKEELGNLGEALKDFKTSLALNEIVHNDMGRIICTTSIAQVLIKQNKPKEAVPFLEKALTNAKKLGDGYLIAPVYINIGWAKMQLREYIDAETSMLKGLELSKKYQLNASELQASKLLSSLYQEKKNYKKALRYNLRADTIEKEILNASTVRYVNDIIFRYDSQKKNNEIAVLAKENENVTLALRKNRTIFLITVLSLALTAGILYILYRQYQLKNDQQLLKLEQTMLRSQMNPHFLFNSLNSIKLYIINNEKKNAVRYLNKFSKLVRKILEVSTVREISLADELETVELYMNIENIRFSNEISFQIEIKDNIDPHIIKVPSLILQPFLENALWHGLSSKKGKKEIHLSISKATTSNICIKITDNGIGRAATEKIKNSKVLKPTSLGISITKDRLVNFSRDYQNSYQLEIIDLYNEDQTSNGTQVVLQIPTI